MSSDTARSWIIANFVTMVVSGVLSLLAFLLRGALGMNDADASFTSKVALVLFEIGAALLYMALYAHMIGVVLRRIVPDLPRRGWLIVHLAMGVVVGTALGLLMLEPDSEEPIGWSDSGFAPAVALVTIGGLLLGATIGGIQASVLRRAAYGTRFWTATSAIAMCGLALVVSVTLPLFPVPPTLTSEIAGAIAYTVLGVMAAAVMLPALKRLQPRAAS